MPCDTLDRVCAGATPTVIKLDLEGHELAALRGASHTLGDPAVLAVVAETFRQHNWKLESLRELERLLGDLGFRPCDYDPVRRELVPLSDIDVGGQNTIYARVGIEVSKRLVSAADVQN